MKHLLAIILAALAFTLWVPAQSLRNKSEAAKIVDLVDATASEHVRHTEATCLAMYARIANHPNPQEVLDEMGADAASYLQWYADARDYVVKRDPSAAQRIPAPNPAIFTPNPDGTVTFHAPPPPAPPEAPNP